MRLTLSRLGHRLCFFSFAALSILIFAASAIHADPLQLQATFISESQTPCNRFVISGADFSFANNGVDADCSGNSFVGPGPFSSLYSDVNLASPEDFMNQGPAYGSVDVPENPGRFAMLIGHVEGFGGPTANIPLGSMGELEYENSVTLIGSFSVCLLPAGGYPDVFPGSYTSCDPNYLDFANINVSIVGADVFDVNCLYGGFTCIYTDQFTGSVPEPASFGFMTLSGSMAALLYGWRKRRPRSLLPDAHSHQHI